MKVPMSVEHMLRANILVHSKIQEAPSIPSHDLFVPMQGTFVESNSVNRMSGLDVTDSYQVFVLTDMTRKGGGFVLGFVALVCDALDPGWVLERVDGFPVNGDLSETWKVAFGNNSAAQRWLDKTYRYLELFVLGQEHSSDRRTVPCDGPRSRS
jgi:hypothetical protein